MKDYAIGIDFGGTNTKLGLLHRNGRVLGEASFSTRAFSRPRAFARKIAQEVSRLTQGARVQRSRIAGVGIGVPGLVDPVRGIIHTLVNVPGWNKQPAARLFRTFLRLPIYLENDVNAAALGEHRFGAAKSYPNVICVTLGTGVGGGIILGSRLYHGASLTAGEIGHIVVEPRGPRCNCGGRGCLEALIGTRGLIRRARILLKEARPGVLAKWLAQGKPLTPRLLAMAAHKGDRAALRVWDEAAEYLGIVFAGLANVIAPDIIVIGGGISAAGDFFLRRVRAVVRERAMSVPAKNLKIVRSRLGNRAGVIGAASIIFDKQ